MYMQQIFNYYHNYSVVSPNTIKDDLSAAVARHLNGVKRWLRKIHMYLILRGQTPGHKSWTAHYSYVYTQHCQCAVRACGLHWSWLGETRQSWRETGDRVYIILVKSNKIARKYHWPFTRKNIPLIVVPCPPLTPCFTADSWYWASLSFSKCIGRNILDTKLAMASAIKLITSPVDDGRGYERMWWMKTKG